MIYFHTWWYFNISPDKIYVYSFQKSSVNQTAEG